MRLAHFLLSHFRDLSKSRLWLPYISTVCTLTQFSKMHINSDQNRCSKLFSNVVSKALQSRNGCDLWHHQPTSNLTLHTQYTQNSSLLLYYLIFAKVFWWNRFINTTKYLIHLITNYFFFTRIHRNARNKQANYKCQNKRNGVSQRSHT